jgi:hypothetical protein
VEDTRSEERVALDKDSILITIRRLAKENDGAPVGRDRFIALTGISESAWKGKYWPRWNDAIREAGFDPHAWKDSRAWTDDELVIFLARLTLELGRYPVQADQKFYRVSHPDFPSVITFTNHLGNREKQIGFLIDLALFDPEFARLYEICAPLLKSRPAKPAGRTKASSPGRVYLVRAGLKHKIGKTDDMQRRIREIQSTVRDKAEIIHVLETDDPAGIEMYWHRRFKDKLLVNEWFELNASDIEAFKSRGTSM